MRITLFAALFFSLTVYSTVTAQTSPYGSLDGNLGTWKWDKPQPKPEDEEEQREPGETTWERLDAERKAELATPSQETAPQSLSPLQLWRLLRGQHDKEDSNQ
jgi:hypothetical protein